MTPGKVSPPVHTQWVSVEWTESEWLTAPVGVDETPIDRARALILAHVGRELANGVQFRFTVTQEVPEVLGFSKRPRVQTSSGYFTL